MKRRKVLSKILLPIVAVIVVAAVISPGIFAKKAKTPVLGDIYFPPVVEKVFDNGLKLYTIEHHEQPVVIFDFMIKSGANQDPVGKAGVADLTFSMLRSGTENFSGPEISEKIDFIGGDLSLEAKRNVGELSLKVLKRHYDEALDITAELLMKPTFPDNEYQRKWYMSVTGLMREGDDIAKLTNNAFDKALFGEHPYGRPVFGTLQSFLNISRDDITSYYNSYFAPNNTVLVVAGDIDSDKVARSIEKIFGTWEKKDIPTQTFPKPTNPKGYSILLLDKPDATQSQIRLGHLGIKRNHPDYQKIKLMNNIIGLGFESRLMQAVRKKGGLTYDINSVFNASVMPGSFKISTFTKNESVYEAISTTLKELRLAGEKGFSKEELARTKAFYSGIITVGLETPSSLAGQLQYLELHHLSIDYIKNFRRSVHAVTLDDVNMCAKKYIDPDNMVITVLGNAEIVKPQLEKLGKVTVVPYVDVEMVNKVKSMLGG